MRVRSFGLLVLAFAGIAPLGVYAALSIARSERTAVEEVTQSNQRLARVVAERIAAHGEGRRELLRAIGAAALRPGADRDVAWVLDDFALQYPHLTELAVYDASGQRLAGPPPPAGQEQLVASALAGQPGIGPVDASPEKGRVLGHTQYVVEPVVFVGKPIGAVAARIDLVDTWEPIRAVRVGEHGFARLVTSGGVLLAHGDPEERREVFADPTGDGARILAAARAGEIAANSQGIDVVTAAADVPGQDWVVIVEQPVAEAYAQARAMRRDLYWLGGAALALVVLLGVASGRRLVKNLERLREHTAVLAAGDLAARAPTDSSIAEVGALAAALDEMAASIEKLHAEARARERLSTFARVAAGLAHDLRLPIETVRAACSDYAADPTDPDARKLFDFMRDKELPRLKRYMDDLQRMAHEGDVPLQLETFDPAALAAEVAADLAATPKWEGVDFAVTGSAPTIDADRNLLRRALHNLAANAADACLTAGDCAQVRIEVGASADGACVELRVSDRGPGLNAEALARLLAGDFHSTKRSTGVGLGFGVARHVARAHRGEIQGASIVGEGTTFTLRIPPARAPATDSA